MRENHHFILWLNGVLPVNQMKGFIPVITDDSGRFGQSKIIDRPCLVLVGNEGEKTRLVLDDRRELEDVYTFDNIGQVSTDGP